MKGNTAGLLGIFDGDPFNDFTGRDGTTYPVTSTTESNGLLTDLGNSCQF
jgi:hypothetical protein